MSVHPTLDPDDTAPALPDGLDDDAVFDFESDRDNLYWLRESYADHQYQPNGRPLTIGTEDLNLARKLDKVLRFIEKRLIAPDLPRPVFKLEALPNGQRQLQLTADVDHFLWSLWTVMNTLIERFPLPGNAPLGPRRPPHLALFQALAQHYGETSPVCPPYFETSSRIVRDPHGRTHFQLVLLPPFPSDPVAWVAALNRFVEDFRWRVEQPDFKATLLAYRRPALENYRGLVDYINQLFERYAKLLVLRVDLSYQEAYYRLHGSDFPELKRHRNKLLRYLRRDDLFPLVGYAWKLEYGAHKRGFHYHLLLFLDGAQARADISLARTVGEYWQDEITGGTGQYFNCNAAKNHYHTVATGLIRHDAAEGMKGLQYLVKYMTKIDPFLPAVLPPGARSFGHGRTPAPKDPRVGGRTRATESCPLPDPSRR